MTESTYRSNVGVVAVAVAAVLLFLASALSADPASGQVRVDEPAEMVVADAEVAVADTETVAVVDTETVAVADTETVDGYVATGRVGTFTGGREGEYELDAQPINPGGQLTIGGGTARGGFINNCFVDFNDDTVLQFLPYQAINGIIEWPYWNQHCEGYPHAIAIEPIGTEHIHLNYVDKTLRFCTDLGAFGRPTDPNNAASPCTEIDPLSEPREAIQPHTTNYAVRVFAYEPATGDRVPFTMNQLRIISGTSEVCFVTNDQPWEAAAPTDEPPGYCGELEVNNWDISASIIDAYEVRIYSRSPDNAFTDIGIATY